MKKQFFTRLIALTVMVMASASVQAADGDGLTPGNAREVMIGSISKFSVSDAGAGAGRATSYEWTVLNGVADDNDADTNEENQNGTATTQGSDWAFATGLNDHTVLDKPDQENPFDAYIKFITAPTSGIYIVEVTATSAGTPASEGIPAVEGCSIRRRFYVSIIDFEVIAYLSDADGAALTTKADEFGADLEADADDAAQINCNDWSGSIAGNTLAGSDLTALHQDYTNAAGDNKVTTRYFAVKLKTTGSGNYKWRFIFDMPGASDNLRIYNITCESGDATFQTAITPSSTAAATTPKVTWAAPNATWTGENVVFVPTTDAGETTEMCVFKVETHNVMSDNDMNWNVRIDQVQLEANNDADDYNNGEKYHTELAGDANVSKLIAGKSATRTIRQSPATEVIKIAD